MRTGMPFVPTAEAAFIAGLTDRQMNRVMDEHLVPASMLSQSGSTRLFARLGSALARFYFETEEMLMAHARRLVVEELAERVNQLDTKAGVLSLSDLSSPINWKVARLGVEVDVSSFVMQSALRARQVDEAEALVGIHSEVMGGMPCFAGTRVPIEIVLGSLDEGMDLDEVRDSYPFLTEFHVAAARVYAQVHPRRGRPRKLQTSNAALVLKSSQIARPAIA